MTTTTQTDLTVAKPRTKLSAHPAIAKTHSAIFTKYIGTVKVHPAEQVQLSLGRFSTARPEKGFSVEISPDPEPSDAITTQVVSVGSESQYELILSISNYGTEAVTAEVWRI